MKNKILVVFAFFITIINLYPQCENIDLILDSSFESGESIDDCSTSECAWNIDDGGYFIQMQTIDGDYAFCSNYGGGQQYIDLAPETNYSISCWIRIYSGDFILSFGSEQNTWTAGVNDWEKVTLSYLTGTTNLSTRIWFYSENTCADLFELCKSTSLGIEDEILKNNISIYPNPNNGIVNIDFKKLKLDKKTSIKVFNTTGKSVFHDKDITHDNYQFYLNTAPGLYFLEINSNNRKEYFKLVKK